MGGHLGFICTEGVGIRVYASPQTIPSPLSRFDTHPTKMATSNAKHSILMILCRNRGLWTFQTSVFHWAMHGLISLLIVKVSTIGKWPFYLYFKSKLHSTFYWRELKYFCVHTILVIWGLKQAWSNCPLCIPFILSGSPKECWLHTCDACIISWRLGLRAPLVTHKNIMEKI